MKFKYPFLTATLLIAALVFGLAHCGVLSFVGAVEIVATFQLVQICLSVPQAIAFESIGITPEQIKEFQDILKELGEMKTFIPGLRDLGGVEGGFAAIKALPGELKRITELNSKLGDQVSEMRRVIAARQALGVSRVKGKLSDECAAALASRFVLHALKSNKLDAIVPDATLREKLISESRGLLGMTEKAALGTADIPLPSNYYSEIQELIAEYGVVRSAMMPWPLSGGTDKPPRSKTGFEFGSIAMNAQFVEKGVQIEFASLESHKIGGIIYTPRELREQSIVALGQYLARMAATRFAWAEDKWGFNADGTGTYENVKGVCQIATDNNKYIQLAAQKTAPSDVTAADFRQVFRKVNSRVRSTGSWYMNNTWEAFLPELNTQANQYNFRYDQSGRALLLGRPIEWTEVMAEFSDQASASANIAAFGDLSWWWFATRGGPRIDESEHIRFDYDQIATRFIEEMDFDYMSVEAMAVVKTGAGA